MPDDRSQGPAFESVHSADRLSRSEYRTADRPWGETIEPIETRRGLSGLGAVALVVIVLLGVAAFGAAFEFAHAVRLLS